MSIRPKTFVGLACIGVFGFFVVDSFGTQLSGYESFTQATESGRRAHIAGTWLRDQPTIYDPDRNLFTFSMADENGLVRRVAFNDPKPANFEDAEKVVVEGQMAGDVFEAEHILVKCPSKYNDAREFQQGGAGAPGVPTVPTSAR